jgi:NADH-quinone oxidoreductase subunit A
VLRDYLPLVVFMAIGLGLGGLLTLTTLVSKKHPNRTKSLPYESGILSTRPAKQRFSIDFYLTAMLFIVFDIELAFLYPLAIVLKDFGTVAVVELVIFVVVLAVALGYIWRKRALEWR